MNNIFDIKRNLYKYIDHRVSESGLDIDFQKEFKITKVENDSIFNLSLSTDRGGLFIENIRVTKSGSTTTTSWSQYFSEINVEVWVDDEGIVYVENHETSVDVPLKILSTYLEFSRGGLLETYITESANNNLDKLVLKVEEKNRIFVNKLIDFDKYEATVFTTEYNYLVDQLNIFDNKFEDWKDKLGNFSNVNKLSLNPDTDNKIYNINEYIEFGSIHNGLITDNTINRDKVNDTIEKSLKLADTSIQKVTFNGEEVYPYGSGNEFSINAITKIRIQNTDNPTGWEVYDVKSDGTLDINDWENYIQPKLMGDPDELLYFDSNGTLSRINTNVFLMDDEIITTWDSVADRTVPSSLLVKNTMDKKVDRQNIPNLSLNNGFVKITTNDQGLVSSHQNVNSNDLVDIIGDYYLTESYEWDETTGVLKLK